MVVHRVREVLEQVEDAKVRSHARRPSSCLKVTNSPAAAIFQRHDSPARGSASPIHQPQEVNWRGSVCGVSRSRHTEFFQVHGQTKNVVDTEEGRPVAKTPLVKSASEMFV